MVDQFDFKGMISGFLCAQMEEQLYVHLEACAFNLGFRQFAMGHHVDLAGPPQDAIRLTNYHPAWIERSLGEGYFLYDPVHQASTRTAAGFLWTDVPAMIRLTKRQKAVLEAARPYGLSEGYTIPVHVPGEYRGTCSFGADSFERLRPNALPIANMIGTYRSTKQDTDYRQTVGGVTTPIWVYTQKRDTVFAYGELSLPLIGASQTIPFARELLFTGAVRYENNSGFGDLVTPKFGLVFRPVDGA